MSRGGRGKRFRGGVLSRDKNAPGAELDYDLDEGDLKELDKPTPLFPPIKIPYPTTFTKSEQNAISWYQQFRDSMRDGSFFTDLDPGIITNDKGKANPRAGVDPFEAIETYTKRKNLKPKRTQPDFSHRLYPLEFFPRELWSTVDPERTQPEWKTLSKTRRQNKSRRNFYQDDQTHVLNNDVSDVDLDSGPDLATVGKRKRPEVDEDDEDEDITPHRRRRRQKARLHDPTKKRSGEKQGLDAEDVIEEDEDELSNRDNRENDLSEDTLSDSHFSDEDEGQEGGYGDNFFDPGEDDGDEGGDDFGGPTADQEGGVY